MLTVQPDIISDSEGLNSMGSDAFEAVDVVQNLQGFGDHSIINPHERRATASSPNGKFLVVGESACLVHRLFLGHFNRDQGKDSGREPIKHPAADFSSWNEAYNVTKGHTEAKTGLSDEVGSVDDLRTELLGIGLNGLDSDGEGLGEVR